MIMNTTHANKDEILKTLYEKLLFYSNEFTNLVIHAWYHVFTETSKKPTAADFQKIEEFLVDFWVFFKENESSLPKNIAENVGSIYSWMKFLHETASENMPKVKTNEINIYLQSIKYELFHYHRLTNQYSREEWEELDYYKIFQLFVRDVHRLVDDLKELSESGMI
jgi:hypothetical protein